MSSGYPVSPPIFGRSALLTPEDDAGDADCALGKPQHVPDDANDADKKQWTE